MTRQSALIDRMPKAELHIHIEGSLEPEQLFAFARRNQVSLPYSSVEALRAAYHFGNLQDFLDLYYRGMSVLRTEEDFHDLAAAYLARAHADRVRHVEMFFDPQGHTARGVPFATVIDGLHRAAMEAEQAFGMSVRLILCFLRHLDEDDAERTLEQALEYRDRIIGIGLDSSEVGHPPSKFARMFRRAREAGFRLVAHAGEEGPPEYVWEALDILGVDRIDHGNRAMEDKALVARLVRDRIPLTLCPLSNLRLGVVGDLVQHPVRRMLEQGLAVTLNSDDPAYFDGYLNRNFHAVDEALELSREEVAALVRNSLAGSFLPAEEKAAALAACEAALAEAE